MSENANFNSGLDNKVQKFEDFFRLFQDKPGNFMYQNLINQIGSNKENVLIVLIEDLLSFDPQLAEILINNPESLLDYGTEAFKNVLKFQTGKLREQNYFVRISTEDKDCPISTDIKDLKSSQLSKLIICQGSVTAIQEAKLIMKIGVFECNLCGAQIIIPQLSPKIERPRFCANKRCKARSQDDFRLIEKLSKFYDFQVITLEENNIDEKGSKIDCVLTYDLVDSVKKSDVIQITGTYNTDYYYTKKKKVRNIFEGVIHVNYIKHLKKNDDNDTGKIDMDRIFLGESKLNLDQTPKKNDDNDTGKIDMDRIFLGESRRTINKLMILQNRLKDLFEKNEWKALEKKHVIQILELEENFDVQFIKNCIEELIKDGTLFEPFQNMIKFTKEKDR